MKGVKKNAELIQQKLIIIDESIQQILLILP
jgi:hypothetical protein